MTHIHRVVLTLVLMGASACSDAVGPDRADGRLLAAGSLALEWSPDGTEIFYFDSGYTHTHPKPLPGRILAVNVASRATRVVVASGAYGYAGYASIAPQGIPPRVTIAGLAYLGFVAEQMALHVLTDTGDVALVSSRPWFTTTPDRSRLLYSPVAWSSFDDSVGVIDLITGSRTFIRTGPYSPTMSRTISPDGNQLLVSQHDAALGFGILNITTGTIVALPDSLFPPRVSGPPIPLGWNGDGVWFVQYGGPPHLIRYNPGAGVADWFTIADASGGTRVVTGGTALASGSSVVWSQNCNHTEPLSGLCTQGAYQLWQMNPLTGVDRQLVNAYQIPDPEFPYVFFAASSPDGRTLAYVLGNELRLVALR